MTQEEEQLLFTDLSGRLRYGVICQIDYCDDAVLWGIPNTDTFTFCDGVIERYISQVTPYLRPMSSMTEEEEKEFTNLTDCDSITETGFGYNEGGTLEDYISSSPFKLLAIVMDWLNKHQFDYRGLIPMGLALPAKPGMYDLN